MTVEIAQAQVIPIDDRQADIVEAVVVDVDTDEIQNMVYIRKRRFIRS